MEWWIPLLYGGLGALTFGIGSIFGGTLVAAGHRQVLNAFGKTEEDDKETSEDAS